MKQRLTCGSVGPMISGAKNQHLLLGNIHRMWVTAWCKDVMFQRNGDTDPQQPAFLFGTVFFKADKQWSTTSVIDVVKLRSPTDECYPYRT